MCKILDALDRIAAEQASYYGITREKHAKLQADMAEAQELIERDARVTENY